MLSERHKRFVEAYASNGGNAADAARVAGYREGRSKGARVAGWKLLRKPEIQEAIIDRVRQEGAMHGPAALEVLLSLLKEGTAEAIKLQAAKDLLDRFGYKPAEQHEHRIMDTRTDEEIEASIRAKASELGITGLPH